MNVTTPRYGDWQFTLGTYVVPARACEEYSGWLQFVAAWYPTEKLTLRLDLLPQYSSDWLLWEEEHAVRLVSAPNGSTYDFRLDWIPRRATSCASSDKWIGIDADLRRAYRFTDAAGNLLPTGEPMAPFTVNNLDLQVRYRYEMGPMSELIPGVRSRRLSFPSTTASVG